MNVFALSDLHLSFATPRKEMSVFGSAWLGHEEKIAAAWKERVREEDLVLVAGDTSWAMKLPQALPDLEYLAALPGRKVLIRGNHDYWWSSPAKVRAHLPEGMFILHHDALLVDGVALAGTRLWIDHELAPIRLPLRPRDAALDEVLAKTGWEEEGALTPEKQAEDERLFQRELGRLELALSRLDPAAALRIALVHFPPLSTNLEETRTTRLFESFQVHHVVFGHLHQLAPAPGRAFFGCRKGIAYHLTSCDYLDFIPALIATV